MPTDLHLLPLHRRAGEDSTDPLPGLYLATPPRKAARSRQSDHLILHLTFGGTATLSAEHQNQLFPRLTETYYQTSGAATSALRAMVESLNVFLLDRNLRAESKGIQTAGLLTTLVLRQDQLLIGQSGPTHVFTVEETLYQHFYDPQTAGHGLGLGKVAGLLVNYLTPNPGTLIILTPAPPPAWNNPSLQTAYGRPLKAVQRGLLKPAGTDLNALIIRLQVGPGKVHLLKAAPVEEVVTQKAEDKVEPVEEKSGAMVRNEVESAEMENEEISISMDVEEANAEVLDPEDSETEQKNPLEIPEEPSPAVPITNIQPQTSEPKPSPGYQKQPPRSRTEQKQSQPVQSPIANLSSKLGPALLTIGRATGDAFRQLGYTLRALITRLLPGSELFTIPSNVMAFIAIAVPIILSIIAFFVYQQKGRSLQYTTNIQFAQAAQVNAQGKTTPEELREAWNAVVFYVNQAEQYQVTEETTALRLEAQSVLDELETIIRLQYVPVLSNPLADNVIISQMAASADNLYLLNQDVGNVVRVWQSGRGYETDLTFRCGPLPNESLIVGPLIDIAVLPPVNYLNAQVMGMDANGILVYCLNDADAPIPVPLFPPDSNWGNPRAFALDNDILYVLDPQTNAVWVYYGDNYEFNSRPRFFFDADVPPMSDVIDLAVDRGELYLLHEDGHITLCTFGFDIQPTRCTDPTPFTDSRVGMENGPILGGTQFAKIAFTPPPDPSIFMLEPSQRAIYHLSLRLTLQRQYRPQIVEDPPRTSPTAFALGPNRLAYLAFGNQVWVASLP